MASAYVSDLFSVQGKHVIVTGGGKGIGLMITQSYMAAGASKVFIISRGQDAIEQVAQQLNKKYPNQHCIPLAANLSEETDILRVVEEIQKQVTHIDVLVNNSGCNWGEALETFPAAAFDKVMNLNVKSVFLLSRALVPLLEAQSSASNPSRIINIGSVDGIRVPALETFSYSASKAAVHQLTRVLAYHLAPKGITVNGIAAGPFPSKMMKATLDQFHDAIVAGLALQRVGEPDDIGGLCLFLSSRAGSWMTGTIIPLDGGALITAKM